MNKAPRVCVQTVVVQCRGRTRSLTVCLHALLIACFSPPMQSDYAVCILLCYPAAPRGGKLRRLFDVCLLLASWGLGRLLGCLRYVYCLLMPPPRSPQEEGEASVGICCQRDSMRPLLQARALDSARSSVCVQMERRPWLQQPCGVCPSLASMPMFAHAEHFAPCFSSLCAFLRVAEVGRCSLMLNQSVHYAVRKPNLRWLRLVLIPQDVRTIWWMRSLLCLPGPHPLFPSVFFPV